MLRAFYRLPVGYHLATAAAFGLSLDYLTCKGVVALYHLFTA